MTRNLFRMELQGLRTIAGSPYSMSGATVAALGVRKNRGQVHGGTDQGRLQAPVHKQQGG